MRTDLIQPYQDESISRRPRPALTALIVGLGLGALFTLVWPGASGLAALARWSAGTALGLLIVALAGRKHLGLARWDLMLGGQLLGLLAIGLFFFVSLTR